MIKNSGLDCQKVGITLPADLIDRIDETRGDIARSTFIKNVMAQHLKRKGA